MLFLPREEGQGLTEYAMILVLVAVVIVVVLILIGTAFGNLYITVVTGNLATGDRTATVTVNIKGHVKLRRGLCL